MKNCFGKRFLFAIVAIVCATVVTIYLKYPGEVYFKLVGSIVGLFLASQTATDVRSGGKL